MRQRRTDRLFWNFLMEVEKKIALHAEKELEKER
jgi:hypothetical protein